MTDNEAQNVEHFDIVQGVDLDFRLRLIIAIIAIIADSDMVFIHKLNFSLILFFLSFIYFFFLFSKISYVAPLHLPL